ncbi:MAG: hypothetical protein WEA56_17235 [Balneolaceae bacterium]
MSVRTFILTGIVLVVSVPVYAQTDTTTVQDGIYSRPFIGSMGKTAIGGYVEGNTNSFVEDGIPEGFSFELRRFNIFLFSNISEHIKLISELEFEHGTEEIALETALIDFEINPAFKLRGGILLPPIGAFNVNHDSPQWEFVERPLVSTEIIPATLSEIGAGAHGKFFPGNFTLSYDVYLTNGLGDGVVLNSEGRTHLASGKTDTQFEEDNNGSPALSGRVAVSRYSWGELGFSYYGGIYNTYQIEGDRIDQKRRLNIFAVDYYADVQIAELRGEMAYASIDMQDDLKELFGEKQWGGHLDIIVPVWRFDLMSYRQSVLNLNLRLEQIDFNAGNFSSTAGRIYDETTAVVPGVSFRPTSDTVFRLNYIRRWHRDLVGNPTAKTAGIQVGFATYF